MDLPTEPLLFRWIAQRGPILCSAQASVNGNSDELWRRPPKREASMFFLRLHSQQHPDTTESENQVGKPAAMKGDSRLMPPSLSKNSKADQ